MDIKEKWKIAETVDLYVGKCEEPSFSYTGICSN